MNEEEKQAVEFVKKRTKELKKYAKIFNVFRNFYS